MSDNYVKASILTLGKGKAVSQFDYELTRGLQSFHDPNKDCKKPRVVMLKVTLKPTEDGSNIITTYESSLKEPADIAGADLIQLSQRGEGYVANNVQMGLNDIIETDDDGNVTRFNGTTGEVK